MLWQLTWLLVGRVACFWLRRKGRWRPVDVKVQSRGRLSLLRAREHQLRHRRHVYELGLPQRILAAIRRSVEIVRRRADASLEISDRLQAPRDVRVVPEDPCVLPNDLLQHAHVPLHPHLCLRGSFDGLHKILLIFIFIFVTEIGERHQAAHWRRHEPVPVLSRVLDRAGVRSSPLPKHETLEKRVTGQPIRPVHSSARGLTNGIQSANVGLPIDVGQDPSAGVVLCGDHGNPTLAHVEAKSR
mmetsp:Transcript_16656/g.37652  ORF Transcript_16656/g.37652 Transcript_16656/m.37652 type:complete len:243 (+) Transcript_16656:981-1709(+)